MQTRRQRIETNSYYSSKRGASKQPIRRPYRKWLLFVALIGLVGFGLYRLALPLGETEIEIAIANTRTAARSSSLNWPQGSQSAVGDTQVGVLDEKPGAVAKPTASSAKLITALVVLNSKPLEPGQAGPSITMTQHDVDRYNRYYANDGSTAIIAAGQQLSQYQLIQGTLVVSSNNYADSLAEWAFGSIDDYRIAAQRYLKSIGAKNTTIGGDASGYEPDTVSTPHDLVLIGIEAYKQPILREIMAQKSVELPLNPVRNNTNWLLGMDGVIGGKTGNSDQAGGVFVGIGETAVGSENRVVVAAVQGEKTPQQAIELAGKLLSEAYAQYGQSTLYSKGQVVARYYTPWGETYSALAQDDIRTTSWGGKSLGADTRADQLRVGMRAGDRVGRIKSGSQTYPLVVDRDVDSPDLWWRIWRLQL
mgnify:CR=1 FL=1